MGIKGKVVIDSGSLSFIKKSFGYQAGEKLISIKNFFMKSISRFFQSVDEKKSAS
jgi:hypothetical protein